MTVTCEYCEFNGGVPCKQHKLNPDWTFTKVFYNTVTAPFRYIVSSIVGNEEEEEDDLAPPVPIGQEWQMIKNVVEEEDMDETSSEEEEETPKNTWKYTASNVVPIIY